MFILDFHMGHGSMFDIFQERILCGLSSYAIVVDITNAQKGGVHHREKHLARHKAFRSLFKSFCTKENVTCSDN